MTEQELKGYYNAFTDAWKFFRKWAVIVPMTEEQWARAVKEGEEFLDKHDRGKMAEYLMLAAMQKLEELERRRRNEDSFTGWQRYI